MSICASVESHVQLTELLGRLKEFKAVDRSGSPVYHSVPLSEVFPQMTIVVTDDLTGQEKTLHLRDRDVRLNGSNDIIRVLCEETRIGINLNLRAGQACFAREDRERLFAPIGVAG